jgi:hypothetical protein
MSSVLIGYIFWIFHLWKDTLELRTLHYHLKCELFLVTDGICTNQTNSVEKYHINAEDITISRRSSWSWSFRSLDLQLPMQSVPITTNVVGSNPSHDEVYSIQHYVIKFVSDLRLIGGFLQVLRFPPPDHHDIAEILLKVALNTIKQA